MPQSINLKNDGLNSFVITEWAAYINAIITHLRASKISFDNKQTVELRRVFSVAHHPLLFLKPNEVAELDY